MFGMGAGELILILVLVLLIFGPKKLPDLAKGIGKALREFRRASTDLQNQMTLDNELGDAVREVQAAATGMPSPSQLEATKRAREAAASPAKLDEGKPAVAPDEPLVSATGPAKTEPAATAGSATSSAAGTPPKATSNP